MIPLCDVIPSRTAPRATVALIAVSLGTVILLPPGGAAEPAAAVQAALAQSGMLACAANVLTLWLLGPTLEDRMGHLRFGAFALLSAACGAGVSAAVAGAAPPPGAGADAAIAGLIAAYVSRYPRSRVLFLVPLPLRVAEAPAAIVPIAWAGLQLGSSLPATLDGAAAWLAGLAAGASAGLVLGTVFPRAERQRVDWWSAEALPRPPTITP